ncbi:MAG: hypothetical protein AAF657_41235, partial [Acidobacteriota bacterium]
MDREQPQSKEQRQSKAYFERLRQRARDQVNQGNLELALELCDRAIAWAEKYGDKDACDVERCNRSSILVNQGRGTDAISHLRRILLSSSNPEICHQAANNISRFHEMRNEGERGLFYARLSLHHAKLSQNPEPIARSYNQLGLLLQRDSYFEDATEHFTRALEVLPDEISRDRSVLLSNLGYCQVMLGRFTPGFSHLFRSLRIIKAQARGVEFWEMFPRLALSFAYLQIDRPVRACIHARRGLILAEEAEMTWQVKNALYLLGESEKLSGNEFQAHRHFTRLQREFYPDDPVIPD